MLEERNVEINAVANTVPAFDEFLMNAKLAIIDSQYFLNTLFLDHVTTEYCNRLPDLLKTPARDLLSPRGSRKC